MTEKQLSRINSLLLGLIIVLNCYVLIAPLVPSLQFWYRHHFNKPQQEALNQAIESDSVHTSYQGPNKVVIPSIFTDQPILEGPTVYTANKGIWRFPKGGTPDKGGNTVLIGHRFLYSRSPAVFYNLDKVQVGDKIGVYWDKHLYQYQVNEVKVVPPTQTDVEAQTEDARLTLYTCTPLWTSKNRLVIVAKQIGANK